MICSAMILVSLISTIILRFCLSKENDRRTNLSSEEHRREAAMAEPCDRVSTSFMFVKFYYIFFSIPTFATNYDTETFGISINSQCH